MGAAQEAAHYVEHPPSWPLTQEDAFHLAAIYDSGYVDDEDLHACVARCLSGGGHCLESLAGCTACRVAMFGIPLQQKWDWFVSGERAPDYYLLSDAALYYYSFVDAAIGMDYLALSEARQDRVDPMITGFNPTDMYAADHIRRVLLTFPGVFSAIGEFSVHKEFVSSKVACHAESLRNPALERILEGEWPRLGWWRSCTVTSTGCARGNIPCTSTTCSNCSRRIPLRQNPQ